MNVLHVNTHLARKGGVETYLLSLLPRLKSRGIRSTWVYGKGEADLYSPSVCVPELGNSGFTHQPGIREAMDDVLTAEQPDLVHIHNVENIGVLQASLDYGPTVVTTHDYRWICPANSFFYKRTQEICDRTCGLGCFTTTVVKHCVTPRPQHAAYYYYRAKWVIENSSRFSQVIAPSGGAQDRLLEAGFSGINVLPYFCPLDPVAEPRPVPEQPTITYIGRIAPNKGHEVFVRALGLCPDNVQGVMVGNMSDSERGDLESAAREAGCLDRLQLRPWATREEVVNILDNTSVFIFPSLWPETLGIVGIEALSRGVPVVASDVGGVTEWLRDGKNGYKVEPKSPEEVSDRVSRLIGDSRQMIKFGQAGIDTINEKFLPSSHADALVRLYDESLETVVV